MSNNKFKILIVEDEPTICSFIYTLLDTNGYKTYVAPTCELGKSIFTSYLPDLIILDLGLPDRDGRELIHYVRQKFMTPIIVLSARTTEADKIEALDLGANDYITKPFSTGELLARVRAALRLNRFSSNPTGVFQAQDLLIQYERRKVYVGGEEIKLTQTEYNIVAFLSEHAGRVMTYPAIVRAIWRYRLRQHQKAAGQHGQHPPQAGQPPRPQQLHHERTRRRLPDDRCRPRRPGCPRRPRGERITLALILFAFTYCLMLALPRFRPFAALGGAGAFLLLGPLRGACRFVSDY